MTAHGVRRLARIDVDQEKLDAARMIKLVQSANLRSITIRDRAIGAHEDQDRDAGLGERVDDDFR